VDTDEPSIIVLFDVDGTLTPPRQQITLGVIKMLKRLLREGGVTQIGAITGSPLLLMQEQLDPLFQSLTGGMGDLIDLFPCNGTQHVVWDDIEKNFIRISDVSMLDELGARTMQQLMLSLVALQSNFCQKFVELHDLPLTGGFIEYRGSLVNWCPIGRNASFQQRRAFIAADTEHDIRKYCLEQIQQEFETSGLGEKISVVTGGQTSFDIYPIGWDKRFVLKHISKEFTWFVGDKCEPGGNDCEIYDFFKSYGRAYQTQSPEETIRIVDQKIIPAIRELIAIDNE